MGHEREKDESERDFEEVHGEGADLAPGGAERPEESDVVEVGGSGDFDEIGDIDEVVRDEPDAPKPAEPADRRGGRQDRPQQQDPQKQDRGRDQRGRNEARGGRGHRRDRREGGDRDRFRRDRDRDRDRGPDRGGPPPAPAQRPDTGAENDPHREPFRDLRRAGRHEPLPDEILPPEETTPTGPAAEDEDEGREWALLEEFNGDGEPKGRRRERGDSRSEVEELGAGAGIDVLEASREDRGRRRGLEPGLSLRDLMPFLRPPRHVIIAGVSTGAGHLRVARAVFEGLKVLDRNLTIRDVDLLEHVAPAFRPAYVRSVLEDIQRRPALFGAPFETQPPTSAEMMPADFDEFLRTVFDDKLDSALLDRRPEWLVLSHWLPLRWLEGRAAAGVTLPKVAMLCADPDFHEWWFSPVVKAWLVSHADVAQRLIAKGVDAESVQVVGVPVNPAFRGGVSREAVAREMGLRRELPTILLRPGGIGPAERSLALTRKLLEGSTPMNLLVIAGKNDRLREELEKIAPSQRSVLKAFGFVENIHELMAVADVLVTRATPHTIAEANAAGLPLVLLRPAPGVEERVADRLLAEGAAVVARDETSLEVEISELLRNRRRLRFMHDRALELAQPDGAQAAIEKLTKLIR
jgi:processive 1,2-diacylglycerol beta-glucosyltransferase